MTNKRSMLGAMLLLAGCSGGLTATAEKQNHPAYSPEEGSAELNKKARKKKSRSLDPNLPNVLIIGDSISIGYTSGVRDLLKGKANVIHNPGNAQGTTHGCKNLDAWLGDTKWDVIHFNWGCTI